MDYRNTEESKDSASRTDESKIETEKVYFNSGSESEGTEFPHVHHQPKDGAVAPKPSDVRNGDLVSLLLAATPPYLYNIPLVPQTFFFSEMLKSFVQAKTERQNLKAQQTHHRRQRKRSWREATPPKPMTYESSDKPLELTTPKLDEKSKLTEKIPAKKYQTEAPERKYQPSDFGNSNFSVEKLANSSITTGSETNNVNITSGDLLPPAPPLWYPLLYPPHPPYGIDPLHFFIDLRVSAHFWDRKLATDKTNNEPILTGSPINEPKDLKIPPTSESPIGKSRHNSAFRVPTMVDKVQKNVEVVETKKKSRNIHYVMSSLKNIYKTLNEREEEKEIKKDETTENNEKKCKDLRALIGLELVVDYVKQESDGEDDKSDVTNPDSSECHIVSIEE